MTVAAVQARLDWWRVLRLYLAAQAAPPTPERPWRPRPMPRTRAGRRVWWALRSRGAA